MQLAKLVKFLHRREMLAVWLLVDLVPYFTIYMYMHVYMWTIYHLLTDNVMLQHVLVT